jgi:hypothetical protein
MIFLAGNHYSDPLFRKILAVFASYFNCTSDKSHRTVHGAGERTNMILIVLLRRWKPSSLPMPGNHMGHDQADREPALLPPSKPTFHEYGGQTCVHSGGGYAWAVLTDVARVPRVCSRGCIMPRGSNVTNACNMK